MPVPGTIVDDSRPPRSKRRWYQFRLRTLLLFVLLVSVGMSWFTVKLHQARKQREAVEAIQKSGGKVFYDYQAVGDGSFNLSVEPPGPAWLRETLGRDFFWEVKGVPLESDAGVEHLEGLTGLESVFFSGPEVTDAALERLRAVSSLRQLSLVNTSVSDAGLRHVKELTNLELLCIRYAGITDAGLEHLDGLTRLKILCLADTNITDSGLKHIGRLASLRGLLLHRTNVTREGVEKLQQRLPNCEVLP